MELCRPGNIYIASQKEYSGSKSPSPTFCEVVFGSGLLYSQNIGRLARLQLPASPKTGSERARKRKWKIEK
jgi:hypothetical protein